MDHIRVQQWLKGLSKGAFAVREATDGEMVNNIKNTSISLVSVTCLRVIPYTVSECRALTRDNLQSGKKINYKRNYFG